MSYEPDEDEKNENDEFLDKLLNDGESDDECGEPI